MPEVHERRAAIALPKAGLALWQLMLAIAILATCLGLLRVNIALGVIAACVWCLSLMRTVRIVKRRGPPEGRVSPWRWCRAGLGSLVVSCCIIGGSDITFLIVYGFFSRGYMHVIDLEALFVGVLAALGVSCLVRCWLWDR